MRIAYCFGMVDYPMLIFMSGIERIGADYNESATISGANVFPKFAYITLSLLKGSIRTNLVMWTVSSVGFFIWGQVFDPVNLPSQTVMPLNYSNFAHTKSEFFSGKSKNVLIDLTQHATKCSDCSGQSKKDLIALCSQ